MSIAVAFSNDDWIVLCADRQMTDADSGLKFEGGKIAWLESKDGKKPHVSGAPLPHTVAFAYCGIPENAMALVQNVTDALYEAVLDADECDLVHEPEYFRQALLPVYKSKDAKGLQTLVALQTEYRCWLFRTKGEQVVLGEREYIGGGDSSVLRYFADIAGNRKLSCEQSTMLGIYLVELASRYVDGCGLGIDVAILEREKPIRVLKGAETAKYSDRFAEFERQIEKGFFKEV